jgi:GT2 family glycosyltransferase
LSLFRPGRAVSCRVARIGDERGVDSVVRYLGEVKYSVLKNSSALARRNSLTGASLMVSRELFLTLGGYDEALRSCEDFDLWLRLLEAGVPAFNIDLPLYLYRVNENGLSRNLLNISYWELEVVKKYYARHRLARGQLSGEAVTLAIWLFKHFVRYEQCRDPELMKVTRRNLELLGAWPVVRAVLLVAQKIGLPWFAGFLLARRGVS